MTKKMLKERKRQRNKEKNILKKHCAVISIFIIFFSVAVYCFSTIDYPSKDALVYEDCTFIRYEYKKEESSKGRVTKYYNIYVEEYDTPLEIDNIVYDNIDTRVLYKLKAGDIVTVSICESKDTRSLYAFSFGDDCILSYDEYLNVHTSNSDGMIKILIVLVVLTSGWMFAEIIYFRKKGKVISWRHVWFFNA